MERRQLTYAEKKERRRVYQQRYRESHREQDQERQRAYYLAHKEHYKTVKNAQKLALERNTRFVKIIKVLGQIEREKIRLRSSINQENSERVNEQINHLIEYGNQLSSLATQFLECPTIEEVRNLDITLNQLIQ